MEEPEGVAEKLHGFPNGEASMKSQNFRRPASESQILWAVADENGVSE
jgi:hypothetical protein